MPIFSLSSKSTLLFVGCERCWTFIYSTEATVYLSHLLSAWGDRMWMFAVALYLNDLSGGSLRLVASYGFGIGGTTLLMGAIVGEMVDRYPRLRGRNPMNYSPPHNIKCPKSFIIYTGIQSSQVVRARKKR